MGVFFVANKPDLLKCGIIGVIDYLNHNLVVRGSPIIMKKLTIVLIAASLLAVGCKSQTAQQTNTQAQNNNQSQSTESADADNSEILQQITEAWKTAGSMQITGQLTTIYSESPQSHNRFTNSFSGKSVWPQSEEVSNNIHDNLNQTYSRHWIVVGNKKFQQTTQGSKTYPWSADFVENPLSKLNHDTTQPYSYPAWLVLGYAQSLTLDSQDGDLSKYTVTPKKIKFSDAVKVLFHQGRLEVGGITLGDQTTGITGNVWINKDSMVVKEEYFIPTYANEQERQKYNIAKEQGITVTINYTNYNQKFTIKEPIATPELDKVTQLVKEGKTAAQIEQQLQAANNTPENIQKARDDKRRADIMQLRSALELYSADYGTFPPSLEAAKSYAGVIPTAPTPADGNCTAQQNTYTYTLVSPQTYTLTFCLGIGSEQYGAGVHTATESSIQ